MLAAFLFSTPLLQESWRLCAAVAGQQQGFAVERVGPTALVAFSAVQPTAGGWSSDFVEVEGKGMFGGVEGGAARVHGGVLKVFQSYHAAPSFQRKLEEALKDCKSVVLAGHGLGGAVAALSALWLLSRFESAPIFCITFGSPMLANHPFSKAILQQRWAGNFCHIVAPTDIFPTLLFSPRSPFLPRIFAMFTSFDQLQHFPISNVERDELLAELLGRVEDWLKLSGDKESLYCPFGSYVFCTEKGAVCMDDSRAIVEFLGYSMLSGGWVSSCIEDHLKYGDYVGRVCAQYMQKLSFRPTIIPDSSSEAGVALALQSIGISYEDAVYGKATNCLLKARQLNWRRNLNNAKMAVSLSKITPFRAELEWYKDYCDAQYQLGYYDAFKRRGASRRDFKVVMNMRKLGRFWDDLIDKMQKNELTPDFHKQPKYVNASRFYELLVEPLEIADYYRAGMHTKKGHYIEHGRNKRFDIFDKWWADRKVGDEERKPRSKYAGLTQDPCFWARVEEARDKVFQATNEMDMRKRLLLLDDIERFAQYAIGMIDRMEVSVDVMSKKSSYGLFREEWEELKSQQQQHQILKEHFPGFQDGMVQ
ncbi:lipase-like PAD4 isoform X2 [Andrographis paniculata]|nr:lipase-like PAD4 isoform X2 [Andrographis paniculata]